MSPVSKSARPAVCVRTWRMVMGAQLAGGLSRYDETGSSRRILPSSTSSRIGVGRDLLADRPDLVHGVGSGCGIELETGNAVPLGFHHFAASDDGKRKAWNPASLHLRPHVVVHGIGGSPSRRRSRGE